MITNYLPISKNKGNEVETNTYEDSTMVRILRNKFVNCNIQKDKYINIREGPNINLKCFTKSYYTDEEKHFISQKIIKKKKTELCKNWEVFHDCYFKNECSFAHGIEELRFDSHISGSKNKICKTFEEKGYCIFGKRCNFRHVVKEKRLLTYQYILENTCKEILNEIEKKDNNETVLKIYKIILFKNKVIM